MASDRKSWEKHVAKIMSLFQGNADSRQQAFLLLDSLITGPLEEGIADILQPIFTGCDFSDASFLWMTQVEQRLDYSSRQSFRKEDLFWPFYELFVRLKPEEVANLPAVMTLSKLHRFPTFLQRPNPCQVLIIENSQGLDGIESCHDIEKIYIRDPVWGFVPDLQKLVDGEGPFVLFGADASYDAIVCEVRDGKRQLIILNGPESWMEEDGLRICLNDYPDLVSCNWIASDFDHSLWDCTTPQHFLDFSHVELHLSEATELPIRARLESMRIKCSYSGLPLEDTSLMSIFGTKSFPQLKHIVISVEEDLDCDIRIDAALLQRIPQLLQLYVEGSAWLTIEDDIWRAVHPLQLVYLQNNDRIEFYHFEGGIRPLAEKLYQCSCETQWAEQHLSSLQTVRRINLLGTQGNLRFTQQLSALEVLLVEHWKKDIEDHMFAGFTEPEELLNSFYSIQYDGVPWELTKRISQLTMALPKESSVCSLKELQQKHDEPNRFSTISPLFLYALRRMVDKQKVPKYFQEWLTQTGPIRVANYYMWMNAQNRVTLKGYPSIGSGYLESYIQTLNLERIFYRQPCGVSSLSWNSWYAIRYNDPRVSIQDLKQATALSKLYVEIPEAVAEVMTLTSLQVLYLNDLGIQQLPEEIGNLQTLSELYLWNNQLTTLPNSIEKLQSLEVINISGNQFTEIPDVLFTLPCLRTICIRGLSVDENQLQRHPEAWEAYTSGQLEIVSGG